MTGGKAPRQAGDRFERACVDALRRTGWLVVRSAGSLGPCDLVALRGDRIPALVQCKVTDNLTRTQRQTFHDTAADAGALAVVVIRPRRGVVMWRRILPNGSYADYEIREVEYG